MPQQSDLEVEIESANLDIKENEDNHNAYYRRGQAYYRKALLETDSYAKSELYSKALSDYQQALCKDSTRVKYIIAKAKLLSVMGKNKECVDDLIQARQLIDHSEDSLEPLEELYVNNTISNIEKLDGVKAILEELRKTGGANIKLIDTIEDLANVTSNINLAIHDNKKLIDDNTNNIIKISKKTQQVIGNVENQEQNIENLSKEVQQLKNIVINHARELANTDDIFKESRLYQKTIMQKEYQALKDSDPNLFTYAKTFSFGLLNYINTYASDIGLYSIEKESLTPDIIGKVIGIVPVIGSSLSGINDFINTTYSIKGGLSKEARIEKFKEIFKQSFLYTDDISLFCCETALRMTDKRYDQIEKADSFIGRIEKLVSTFEQKIKPIIENITSVDQGNIEERKANISKLALLDLSLFVGSICQDSSNRLDSKQLEKLINDIPFETISKEVESEEQNCIICNVNDVVYDNELLNHPDMFNNLASIYGANKVLELSDGICPSLINTAIQDENVDLLVGAIVSLDTGY